MERVEKLKFITSADEASDMPRSYAGFSGGYADPLWGQAKGQGDLWEVLSRAGRSKSFNVFHTNPPLMAGGHGNGDLYTFDGIRAVPTRAADPETNPRNVSTERWQPYVNPYLEMISNDPRNGQDTRSANKRTVNETLKR